MNHTINFLGKEHTNKSSRKGHKPICIVNHITQGTKKSCINWFTSENNTVSSAHFLVAKDGSIYQFVPIEEMAWGNGLKQEAIQDAAAPLVKEQGVNPNLYSISIEHEGFYEEAYGDLTMDQLKASIWLHDYIIRYVKEQYGFTIPADRKHILGHCDVDPVRKPHCPGDAFPYDQIIDGVNKLQGAKDIEGHWAERDIKKVIETGILKGYPDGSFKPNQNITRAELAVVISRILEYKS